MTRLFLDTNIVVDLLDRRDCCISTSTTWTKIDRHANTLSLSKQTI